MSSSITPITLAQSPSTESVDLPSYDWETQSRGGTLVAGRYTSGSIQTFDSKGMPKDSKSDQND